MDDHADEVGNVDKLDAHLVAPRLDARGLEHVVHHLEQDLAVLLDLVELAARFPSIARNMRIEQIREGYDRSQRRAQLVAHDGEEVGLVLVVPLQALVDALHVRTLLLKLLHGRPKLVGAFSHLAFEVSVQHR